MEPLTSTELAAYVAGTLPAERMLAITQWAETDPELAARLFVVQELAGHIDEIRTWWAQAVPPPPVSGNGPRPDLAPREAPERCHVFEEAEQEALRHKWIESEKTGGDLGETALRCWVQRHWWGYLKARWIEHLEGRRFWVELDHGDFGLLQRRFQDQSLLLDRILDRFKAGQENLDIICWAHDWGIPVEPVLQILEVLAVNGGRLARRFDTPPSSPLPERDLV
jgi:hypothetical protein